MIRVLISRNRAMPTTKPTEGNPSRNDSILNSEGIQSVFQ